MQENQPVIRAIVVEDERLPRLALIQKLSDFAPQVEVVDSCATYQAALESILRHRPDLLFLDIQLQGRDAMQLLDELKTVITLPYIIFTTAYNDREYLMKAIKFSAVDYLLKPIDRSELALAISKVMQAAPPVAVHQSESSDRLTFRTASGRLQLQPSDILYIRADGNYAVLTTMHGFDETVLVSLAKLEQWLDPTLFVRADRSTIVNLRNVYKVNVKRGVCLFSLTDGSCRELKLSRNGVETLLGRMTE